MARIKSYVQDTNITDQDRILGSSFEGVLNNQPRYQTKNYKITDLAGYFSKNFDFEGVNFDLLEIKTTVDTTFEKFTNLSNSLGNLNNDGSLASISVDFANDLVAAISTVPDTFTELALSNLNAIPQAFADFLFTIADINEAFANQVLNLATSVAYATADQFDALELLVINNTDDIDAITGSITSLTTTVNENTGDINANALQLDLIATRVTTAEVSVVGLQTDIVELNTDVNTITGDIATQATQLSLIGNRVTTSESEITNLQSDFTDLSTTVDGNTGNITTNATQISSLSTVVDTANVDIAGLKTDVTVIETSIDNLTGEIQANASDISLLTTNVNTIAADVTAVQTDVTVLQTDVNQNTGDIATNATQVSLLANRVTTTESNILNTQTDVTSLTTTVDGNTGNISTNASNISILQTNVTAAQADITGIITNIQQIETSVDNVTGDVEANATAITGLGTRVTTAEGDITNVQGNITTLQTNLNTQTGRIDTNVSNIATLGTRITTAEVDISAAETSITNLTGSVNANTGDISSNASAISSLSTTVNAQGTSITNLSSEVTTLETNLNTQTGRIDTNASNINTLSTTVTNNYNTLDAAITTVDNARITGDSALSSSITSLTASVNGNTSSITTNANAISTVDGKLSASYGITVDAGGRVAGLKLLADGTTGSEFIARANTFAVDMPNGTRVMTVNSGGLVIDGSGTFTGTLDAGLVNIASNIVTFGASDSAYSQSGKIRFNNYLGTQIGELSTNSSFAGGAPRGTITLETLGSGTGLDPVLSLRGGYGWDIGDSNMGAIYGYHVDGITKLNLFADTVFLNSGPYASSTGYQRIWGNFTIQWVRRTYTTNQQVPATAWPIAFTSVFGAVISKGWPYLTYQTQNEAASVSYTTTSYYVDMNNSAGGTFFIIALGMIADPT